MGELALFQLYLEENWGIEKSSDFSTITQTENSRANILTQAGQLQSAQMFETSSLHLDSGIT